MLSCELAEDSQGAWRITWECTGRHLFVYYSDGEGVPEPADWAGFTIPGVAIA
jgi:hypothetical protein